MARHLSAPTIFVCHDHLVWHGRITPHPQIQRYAGVSLLCERALLDAGAPPDRTILLPNFVDTNRFASRDDLPEAPRRALLFSNYASPGGYIDAIQAACSARGLTLDIVGEGFGRLTSTPELALPNYDVVFAKGRAAIEALAVGCAVILCDFPGLGPLVTSGEFDRLRPMNFGWEALDRPHDAALIEAELERYDASDAAKVRDRIRQEASLEAYVVGLEQLYGDIMSGYRGAVGPRPPLKDRLYVAAASTACRTWPRLPLVVRRPLGRVVPAAKRTFASKDPKEDRTDVSS
jgi:glycosyltransferase involved in cell wall biosynthesis